MASFSVQDILNKVASGQIRIPKFQRGFVWEPDRVAYLMDSIYKSYPVGSLLLWRTSERLENERKLGPFRLPEPEKDFPIDYVLDGQQRLTSIFSVFQSNLESDGTIDWLDIYFDLSANDSPQETQIIPLKPEDVDSNIHVPLSSFFNVPKYAELFRSFDPEKALTIERVRGKFQTCQIPYESTETTDKSTVAIIFERVNRQGVELDTFQLLTAWTWSEDFALQEQFEMLGEEVRPFGFGDLGEDTNLLLRCCAAILTQDASPKALMEINGEEFRKNFDRISNGIKGAIDFLKANFFVQNLSNLPFSTMIVPLAVYFAIEGNKEKVTPDDHRRQLVAWFWRTAFSRRYSSGVLRNLKADIEEATKLRDGQASRLGAFQAGIDDDFFVRTSFSIGNVNSKSFILLIAQNNPLTFISGQPVNLAEKLSNANKAEFHHLMPKKFLRENERYSGRESLLANFSYITRSENRELGGDRPSAYRSKMTGEVPEVIRRSLIPEELFSDDYEVFLQKRSELLVAEARRLMEIEPTGSAKQS